MWGLGVRIGLGAACAGVLFLYVAASPWLTWYSLPADNTVAIFSARVPDIFKSEDTYNFVSVVDRWRYVGTHQSWQAWQKTLATLLWEPRPWRPAALVLTQEWFDEPTLIVAVADGEQIRFLAQPTNKQVSHVLPRIDVAPAEELSVRVPGLALVTLPDALREPWNVLLRQRLGLVATKPDIIGELTRFDHITISIHEAQAAVGVVSETHEEQERWSKITTQWIVDEDRFRRPADQSFRLPDGTLGRERVAGLPREVFQAGQHGHCRWPLPEAPALYICNEGSEQVLANFTWAPSTMAPRVASDWEVTISDEFLVDWPALTSIQAHGTSEEAAGVVRVR